MPPARKRVRTFDPARTRAAVLAQYARVREGIARLTPDQLEAPTRLGDWTVRELTAHLSVVVGSVVRSLELPEPARRELALMDYPAVASARAGEADTVARETAAEGTTDELFARAADRLPEALATVTDERLIPTRLGAMRLADFLVTQVVELVVRTDDLNDATGLGVPFDRQAQAITTRFLADALAVKAPGGAVEVRVPPFAVVQCGAGPRHTRGTPPNVVETDPLTWTRLATGRTGWATEVGAGRVTASGDRANLTATLPVLP
ncbi:maleylpyruvate isomerase family mycothiol-dependent enzyme [Streptomyces uncialis]|uniref:maleylpyruvate isomerase family mycothiol-dependent enzyme n=1 Tax=Streptomyces uncialis TaxID=1048205 RepID=UPI0033E3BBB4